MDNNNNEKTPLNEKQWLDSLQYVLEQASKDLNPRHRSALVSKLLDRLKAGGIDLAPPANTPYCNTIPVEDEPEFPGDRDIERRIKSLIRWNAMAMVVTANRNKPGIGGHISTYASAATLLEVGFNHFFHAGGDDRIADLVYFQGHASPGVYARAFLEGRLTAEHLANFRSELAPGGGLSSYPHPYLMEDFWQFPTVSMGLGPITSIYQARFIRYLKSRDLLKGQEPNVWCYVGDGETDEPETLGALTLAAREGLDNLTWVVNCNLQRLDGPVRGNGKIIQELEGAFRGAGWNVIKVIWGASWDPLLAKDYTGRLRQVMEETVDGEYQKYSVSHGSYARKHFFGRYPEVAELVNHLKDEDLRRLKRGGHDPKKVYAAYKSALEHKGRPTVILAKTVKGYGLGEAGEGRNITHQQKKLNEKELREFKERFGIPISDEEVVKTPFYRPAEDSPEMIYLKTKREALGGYLPARKPEAATLNTPELDFFDEFLKGSGEIAASSTMAFVRMLSKLMRHKGLGKHIVPIIPDEARTFGMDALFRDFGIYSSKGQLYEPVDKESILYYHEDKKGQILEEGITEAGSFSSFIAAGTAYANLKTHMIPFYVYYSMFGFQRVGDLAWLAADSRTRGFLLGATSGRTTLNGEGLQHQDGQSLLIATTIPTLEAYDPAFACEISVIIQDGMRRMYQENEDVFYYIALYNEPYVMPPLAAENTEGILKGLYCFEKSELDSKLKVQLFGSGPIMREVIKAKELLAEKYNVAADIWSATSYKRLRDDAASVQRINALNPELPPKRSYLEECLDGIDGPVIAASDHVSAVAQLISPWVPNQYVALGTDGFGRSETRENLRRFFEIDAESITVHALSALAREEKLPREIVNSAMQDFGIKPDKADPICS